MRCDEEGADAARAMAGAATAVEKKALVLFALFSALRERRCTPREVSILDDVDGRVGGAVVRASSRHVGNKLGRSNSDTPSPACPDHTRPHTRRLPTVLPPRSRMFPGKHPPPPCVYLPLEYVSPPALYPARSTQNGGHLRPAYRPISASVWAGTRTPRDPGHQRVDGPGRRKF